MGGWGPLRARSRRRHGTDGGREDERVRPAFSRAHGKLENFRVVETRRDVTTFSLETLRVANQEACSLDLLCVSGKWGRRRNGRPPKADKSAQREVELAYAVAE